jgi:hypothetical protein
MMSDPHLHYPYVLSDHAELEAIAQGHLAARPGPPALPLLTLPLVLRLVVESAIRHLGRRVHGSSAAPRSAATHA